MESKIAEILSIVASVITIFVWLGIKPERLFRGSAGNDVGVVTLSRNKVRFLLIVPTLALLLSLYGLYLSYNGRAPSSYFLTWRHNDAGGATVIVNTASLASLKGRRRLMVASVMINPKFDEMDNPEIAKSRTYEIETPILQIDTFASPEFHQKEYLGVNIQNYLIDVPTDFAIEKMATLADAERLGGRILEHEGFTIAPEQPFPPSTQ